MYEVKPERGSGRGRILHRNMLMPCNALLLEWPTQCTVGEQKHQTPHRKRQTEMTKPQTSDDSGSSDEEEHYWAHRLRHQHLKEPDVPSPVTPEIVHQLGPADEVEGPAVEVPLPKGLDSDTPISDAHSLEDNAMRGSNTQGVTQTVPDMDTPIRQVPELSETQPRRSKREKRPVETLTYESLGQPAYRVVHHNPCVNTMRPVYGQYSVPWLYPQMCGIDRVQLPVRHY